jgi:hypothetical protein
MTSGRKWRRARRSSRTSAGSLCSAENSRHNPRLAECVLSMDISRHPGVRPGNSRAACHHRPRRRRRGPDRQRLRHRP